MNIERVICSNCGQEMFLTERDTCTRHADCVLEKYHCPNCANDYDNHMDVR